MTVAINRPKPAPLREDQRQLVLRCFSHKKKRSEMSKITTVIAGRRYGKTTIILEIMLRLIKKGNKYVHYMTANPSQYEEIWTQLLAMFEAKGKEERIGLPYFISNKNGSRRILYFSTGTRVYFHSATTNKTINKPRGGKADAFIFDECQDFTSILLEQAMNSVASPMLIDRDGKMFLFGTIPYVPNHYFTKAYVMGAYAKRGLDNEVAGPDVPFDLYSDELEEAAKNGTLKFYDSIRKPTSANTYIKKHALEAFINSMPLPVVKREVEALFDYSTSDLFCNALDDDKGARYRIFNDSDEVCKIFPYEPIHISFDFNNNPMPAILCQYKSDYSEIRVIKEFGLAEGDKENTTIEATVNKIKKYLQSIDHLRVNKDIYITGDYSGNNWNGANPDGRSYLKYIKEAFNLPSNRMKIETANPRHRDSYHQLYNWMMHHPKLYISKHCPRLRKDMLVTKRINFNIDKKHHDPHFLDAFRYFLINIIRLATPPKTIPRINTLDDFKNKIA